MRVEDGDEVMGGCGVKDLRAEQLVVAVGVSRCVGGFLAQERNACKGGWVVRVLLLRVGCGCVG